MDRGTVYVCVWELYSLVVCAADVRWAGDKEVELLFLFGELLRSEPKK